MRVVYVGKKLKVLRNCRNFIVVRVDNTVYSQHGHFKTLYKARAFVNMIDKGELPRCHYYLECARRVLTDTEFRTLKRRRPKGAKGYKNRHI